MAPSNLSKRVQFLRLKTADLHLYLKFVEGTARDGSEDAKPDSSIESGSTTDGLAVKKARIKAVRDK